MDSRQIVLTALEVFRANPNAEGTELSQRLRGAGLSELQAQNVLAFVPLGFGRALLFYHGVYADPRFLRAGAAPGNFERLESVPIYCATCELAVELFLTSDSWTYAEFISVAGRSGEVISANRMADAGSRLTDLMLGPPIVFAPPATDLDVEIIDAEIMD